jgi:phage/conjugal plasmid C-4 type zinc finger TraR family protein
MVYAIQDSACTAKHPVHANRPTSRGAEVVSEHMENSEKVGQTDWTTETFAAGGTPPMAVGWAQDGAVQEQIDASVDDAVNRARLALGKGESLAHCEECGEDIPEARRRAVPGARRCVVCQSEADRRYVDHSPYNRRGSKDSQLK